MSEEWLSDLRGWLEWQKSCGASHWAMEDLEKLNLLLKTSPQAQRKRQTPLSKGRIRDSPSRTSRSTGPSVRTRPQPERLEKKSLGNKKELGGGWGKLMTKRPEDIGVDKVSTGAAGLKSCRDHREKNCPNKICRLGVGRPEAPVVLIEGHQEPLAQAGLTMLSKMREHVLSLSREKLFWLPVREDNGCGLCHNLVRAQFNALEPKAVLIMGEIPLKIFSVVSENTSVLGSKIQIKSNQGLVPAMQTLHPNRLLQHPEEKKISMKHLRDFKEILRRLRLL